MDQRTLIFQILISKIHCHLSYFMSNDILKLVVFFIHIPLQISTKYLKIVSIIIQLSYK